MTFMLPTGDKIRYRGKQRFALIALGPEGKGAIIARSNNRGYIDGNVRKYRRQCPIGVLFLGDRMSGKVNEVGW